MKKVVFFVAAFGMLAGCTTTETAVHSYNGNTVEIELYGDTFAYGSSEQQQAQLNAAKAQAEAVCKRPANFLSRRMDHQPQHGMFYVPARHIALFQCV